TGYMDELRVYDQALTPTEVERLADYGGTNPPPLVLDPPIVHTTAATSVTPSSATLTGTIDDRGYNTSYRFECGKTSSYGQVTPDSGTLGQAGTASIGWPVTGLDPATTYHYRLMADQVSEDSGTFGAAGSVHGEDMTFHTGGLPQLRFTAASV